MIDLHVHSTISHDAKSTIVQYCTKAREIGLKEIGFSEHLDLCGEDPHRGRHDYEKYKEEIAKARKDFPGLVIRMGIEVTYLKSIQMDISSCLESREYDYVLGAIHLADEGRANVSEEAPCREYFSREETQECYEEFFELTMAAVRSGLFDALAHLDIINRYGLNYAPDWEWRQHYGPIRRILEGMIKRNMALEINTSGMRQIPGRPYPEQGVLKLYHELGGRMITVGSDAHQADELARGVPQAVEMAQKLGFTQVISFERRVLQWKKIESAKT